MQDVLDLKTFPLDELLIGEAALQGHLYYLSGAVGRTEHTDLCAEADTLLGRFLAE